MSAAMGQQIVGSHRAKISSCSPLCAGVNTPGSQSAKQASLREFVAQHLRGRGDVGCSFDQAAVPGRMKVPLAGAERDDVATIIFDRREAADGVAGR